MPVIVQPTSTLVFNNMRGLRGPTLRNPGLGRGLSGVGTALMGGVVIGALVSGGLAWAQFSAYHQTKKPIWAGAVAAGASLVLGGLVAWAAASAVS